MNFGLLMSFRNSSRHELSYANLYAKHLELCVEAEELGFDTIWLSEHHFVKDGYSPSVLPLAAAIASRTTRIRIGTLVLLMPLHNPLHVAEDAATIDVLSNGRFDLGLGQGCVPSEFAAFNVPREQRSRRLREGVEIIRRAFTEENVTFEGKCYTARDVTLYPKPVQKPHPPIWIGARSRSATERAGRLGYHLAGIGAQQAEVYREALRAVGRNPADFNIAQPCFGFIAAKKEKAWDDAEFAFHYLLTCYSTWIAEANDIPGDESFIKIPPISELRESAGASTLFDPLIGSPDDAIARIEAMQPYTTHLAMGLALPGMDQSKIRASMKLFAKNVIPHFRNKERAAALPGQPIMLRVGRQGSIRARSFADRLKHFPLNSRSKLVRTVANRLTENWLADPEPTVGDLVQALNSAFWASMQHEEGRLVRSTLALTNPIVDPLRGILRLTDPMRLSPEAIAKLSASFPLRPGAIGVNFDERGPLIWGVLLVKPPLGWLIDVLGPGFVAVRNAPYIDAVLLPDGSNIVFPGSIYPETEWNLTLEERVAEVWKKLLHEPVPPKQSSPEASASHRMHSFQLLRVLSLAMLAHRRGGSILLVNPQDKDWQSSVDIKYPFGDEDKYIGSLLSAFRKSQPKWWRDQMRRPEWNKRDNKLFYFKQSPEERALFEGLRLVGGLTAVDGAVVMSAKFELMGYGAKLRPSPRNLEVIECLQERERRIDLQSIGGTRHQSAAQFVLQHPNTLMLVASQDGRFTIFSCNASGAVLASRMELLLL